jgi:hypothetical protein
MRAGNQTAANQALELLRFSVKPWTWFCTVESSFCVRTLTLSLAHMHAYSFGELIVNGKGYLLWPTSAFGHRYTHARTHARTHTHTTLSLCLSLTHTHTHTHKHTNSIQYTRAHARTPWQWTIYIPANIRVYFCTLPLRIQGRCICY